MAATVEGMVRLELIDLDKGDNFTDLGIDGTTPTASAGRQIRTLAVANTAEALGVGDLAVVTAIAIKAVDFDLDVDLDFSSSFDADFTVKAGELPALIPNPAGTVYVNGSETDETPQYVYLAVGTT